jgi:hypothetical protein
VISDAQAQQYLNQGLRFYSIAPADHATYRDNSPLWKVTSSDGAKQKTDYRSHEYIGVHKPNEATKQTEQTEPPTFAGFAGYPTPTARDWKGPSGRAVKGEALDLPAVCAMVEGADGGQLNPSHVRWMMGFPKGWDEAGIAAFGKQMER